MIWKNSNGFEFQSVDSTVLSSYDKRNVCDIRRIIFPLICCLGDSVDLFETWNKEKKIIKYSNQYGTYLFIIHYFKKVYWCDKGTVMLQLAWTGFGLYCTYCKKIPTGTSFCKLPEETPLRPTVYLQYCKLTISKAIECFKTLGSAFMSSKIYINFFLYPQSGSWRNNNMER